MKRTLKQRVAYFFCLVLFLGHEEKKINNLLLHLLLLNPEPLPLVEVPGSFS